MSRSRYKIYETQFPYFLTLTINNWIPIFTRPVTTSIILDALQYRQQHRDFSLYAYVILENHLHLIVQSNQLNKEIASFKSWTARQIIDVLKAHHSKRILKQLAFHKKAHKQDRQYQLWEEGSHPQQIQNQAMMRQKVEYIHNNPVKRGYVDQQEHWRYSSARNYIGMEGLIMVEQNW